MNIIPQISQKLGTLSALLNSNTFMQFRITHSSMVYVFAFDLNPYFAFWIAYLR